MMADSACSGRPHARQPV